MSILVIVQDGGLVIKRLDKQNCLKTVEEIENISSYFRESIAYYLAIRK